jgi:hypothetical protein
MMRCIENTGAIVLVGLESAIVFGDGCGCDRGCGVGELMDVGAIALPFPLKAFVMKIAVNLLKH